MEDDGGAIPLTMKLKKPIGESNCEETIICLYLQPSNGSSIWLQWQMQQTKFGVILTCETWNQTLFVCLFLSFFH